jgi:hypothetical protein
VFKLGEILWWFDELRLENDLMSNFRFGLLWVKKMVWKIEGAELNLLEMTF